MKFFEVTEIRGKLPDPLVDAFERSEFQYLLKKKELDKYKEDGKNNIDGFLSLAKTANEAYLEWKGANLAIARFLKQFKASSAS